MFSDDLADMIADLPQSITVNGIAYTCSADDEQIRAELQLAGFAPSNTVSVTVLKSTLAAPSIGQLVIYSGRDYRVDDVQDSPDGVSYRAVLVAED